MKCRDGVVPKCEGSNRSGDEGDGGNLSVERPLTGETVDGQSHASTNRAVSDLPEFYQASVVELHADKPASPESQENHVALDSSNDDLEWARPRHFLSLTI